jgi:hypothetical protein
MPNRILCRVMLLTLAALGTGCCRRGTSPSTATTPIVELAPPAPGLSVSSPASCLTVKPTAKVPELPQILSALPLCDDDATCSKLTDDEDAALWAYVETLTDELKESIRYSSRAWMLCGAHEEP